MENACENAGWGATTPITEDQAFRMWTLSRRLCVALQSLDDEFKVLLDSPFVRKDGREGITHFENIPVLLDLVEESAREALGIAEAHANRF